MRSWSFVLGGALSLAAAAVLVTLSFGAPRTFAGNIVCVTATPPIQPGVVTAAQVLPVCTPVQIVRSATPTFTATVPATSTPVPVTPAPTQAAPTQAAPTSTQPSGGTGGQVTAPNTGSGSDGGSGYNSYLLLAAGAVAAVGGSSLLVALKRRR